MTYGDTESKTKNLLGFRASEAAFTHESSVFSKHWERPNKTAVPW